MRIELFEVRFDNTHAIYSAGQTVSGHVVIKLTKATWIDCVLIKFSGKARSRWEVNNGDSTKTYQANEVYIDCEYCLYKSQNDSDKHPPGTHLYPFDFTLPPDVPSSFEGRRGFIRYNCLVALDRGWKGRLEVEQDLTVIRHLDLAALPDAGLPVNAEDEDSYEGCCCDSGVVTAALRLSKRGFVSGEPCYFDVFVNNQATSSIRGVCLLLVQTVHYTGYSHSLFSSGNPKYHDKVNNWTLFELEEEIGSMRAYNLYGNCCVIPAVAPSLLEGCNIIEIMYEIQMQVPVGWRTMQVSSPIYIGTIPLRVSERSNQNSTTVPSSSPPSLDYNSSSPPVRSQVEAPPSYEECVFGRMESQEGHSDHDERILDEDSNTTAADNSAASRRSRFHRLPSYPYYSMSHFTNNNPVYDPNSAPHRDDRHTPGVYPSDPSISDGPLLMPQSQHDPSTESLPPPPSYESLQNSSMDAQTRLLNS